MSKTELRIDPSEDDGVTNTSGNQPFEDVLRKRFSRRKVLAGSLATAATAFFGASHVAQAARGGQKGPNLPKGRTDVGGLVGFDPVPIAEGSGPLPAVSSDYRYQVLIPWGDPVNPAVLQHGPLPWDDGLLTAFDPTLMTADQQAERIGIGHDGMWFFPTTEDGDQGMLCINHEFGRNTHVFGVGNGAGNDASDPSTQPASLEDVRKSQHAHGVSVVAIARDGNGDWSVVPNDNSRRIHVNTPVTFSGPVAGTALIDDARGDFMGTVNNCANGYTPWGTYLTCEENFNGYFGDATGTWTPDGAQARYGFDADGFEYGWEKFDPRFDLANPAYAKEENRFGWVVEIDPMDGSQIPVKRTALGRVKHEGVAVAVGRGGRAVCYMGDDQRFDYIYKFVSESNWKSMRARGMSPLDHGTLYAARFNEDGSGDWLELTVDNPDIVAEIADKLPMDPDAVTQAHVLTYARLAADAVGATPMDRPEWTTVAPNGDVFCTLTNNSRRTIPDAANPLAPNADGHIIKWRDSANHVGTTFDWEIYIFAKDTHGAGDESNFSDPDGLWADPDGRLFIETDGGQKEGLNNQLLVSTVFDDDPKPARLLTGVTDDEITGLAVTPDRRTLFCNTQHPGNGNANDTNFPVENEIPDGMTVPRDCTFVLTRKDGGIVGS
jgi:secreted PhoX family phosphatase